MDGPFPIVGVGASAGGVEALEGLFRNMPADLGVAFVIVTHVAPNRESLLPEILARDTRMPVSIADHDQSIRRDHIYVAPADAVLGIQNGRLRVRPLDVARERTPIDALFAALAEDQKAYAIGIVLSGGGSDGTLGIKAIKEHGGLTLAQATDGSGPRHASMPASAIASGLVDLAVPVEAMPEHLGPTSAISAFWTSQRPTRSRRKRCARRSAPSCSTRRVTISAATRLHLHRRIERRMQVLQIALPRGLC